VRGAKVALCACALLASCKGGDAFHEMNPSWSRMMKQPRGDAFGQTSVFADGMVMRTPPPGTRPIELHETPDRTPDGEYVKTLPAWIGRASIEDGHARFDQLCAVCHGVAGDGDSAVAAEMPLREPPSFVTPRLLALEPGAIHEVIRDGYGFMPSYAAKLDDDERWEVVAYVLALRRSRHAVVSELPPDLVSELRKEAP